MVQFSRDYPTYRDWILGPPVSKNYFRRVTSLHRLHPDWTLKEIRGHKGKIILPKFFRCQLITTFNTIKDATGRHRWLETEIELKVYDLVILYESLDKLALCPWWEQIADDLDSFFADPEGCEDISWIYKLHEREAGFGQGRKVELPPYWGLSIEEDTKSTREKLTPEYMLSRLPDYGELKYKCKKNLGLTWIGNVLQVILKPGKEQQRRLSQGPSDTDQTRLM